MLIQVSLDHQTSLDSTKHSYHQKSCFLNHTRYLAWQKYTKSNYNNILNFAETLTNTYNVLSQNSLQVSCYFVMGNSTNFLLLCCKISAKIYATLLEYFPQHLLSSKISPKKNFLENFHINCLFFENFHKKLACLKNKKN